MNTSTKAIKEYCSLNVSEKLSFNAYHRPGVNVIRKMKNELKNKKLELSRKIRINLTGSQYVLPTCRFYFWTSNPRYDMRNMSKSTYKKYMRISRELERINNSSCLAIEKIEDDAESDNVVLNEWKDFIN